jgi:hypothetical protein
MGATQFALNGEVRSQSTDQIQVALKELLPDAQIEELQHRSGRNAYSFCRQRPVSFK